MCIYIYIYFLIFSLEILIWSLGDDKEIVYTSWCKMFYVDICTMLIISIRVSPEETLVSSPKTTRQIFYYFA